MTCTPQDDIQIIINQQLRSQQQTEHQQLPQKRSTGHLSFLRKSRRPSSSPSVVSEISPEQNLPHWRDWLRLSKWTGCSASDTYDQCQNHILTMLENNEKKTKFSWRKDLLSHVQKHMVTCGTHTLHVIVYSCGFSVRVGWISQKCISPQTQKNKKKSYFVWR